LKLKTLNLDKMKIEEQNLNEPQKPQLNIGAVSGSLLTLKRSTGCGICGSKMVYIRGKYPKDKKRKICPTCAYERLEQINEISSRDYGKCYQSNDR
jgi:transposase-like protein